MPEDEHSAVYPEKPRHGYILVGHDLGNAPGAVEERVCGGADDEGRESQATCGLCSLFVQESARLAKSAPSAQECVDDGARVGQRRANHGCSTGAASDKNLQTNGLHHGRGGIPGGSGAVLFGCESLFKLRADHWNQFGRAGMVRERMHAMNQCSRIHRSCSDVDSPSGIRIPATVALRDREGLSGRSGSAPDNTGACTADRGSGSVLPSVNLARHLRFGQRSGRLSALRGIHSQPHLAQCQHVRVTVVSVDAIA